MSKNGHLYSNEKLKPNLLMYFLVHKNEKWNFCEFATVYTTMHSNKKWLTCNDVYRRQTIFPVMFFSFKINLFYYWMS